VTSLSHKLSFHLLYAGGLTFTSNGKPAMDLCTPPYAAGNRRIAKRPRVKGASNDGSSKKGKESEFGLDHVMMIPLIEALNIVEQFYADVRALAVNIRGIAWIYMRSHGLAALQILTAWHILVADERNWFAGLVNYANILFGPPFGNVSPLPELDSREQKEGSLQANGNVNS
jgi:hypothetical protein